MDITQKDITKFKALYSEKFGISLTDKMALVKLSMLVRQMELIYRPVRQEHIDALDYGNGNCNEQLPIKN